jgi:hypothetical protein
MKRTWVITKSMFRMTVVLGILVSLLAIPTLLFAQKGDNNSILYPTDSQPFGMTYGDWSVAWNQYTFSIPASINPILDLTGAYCSVAQSSGPVFFLSASVFSFPVTRTCTVSAAGKALLLPVAFAECSTVEPPPFHGNDPQELRTCAATFSDGIGVDTLKVTVDGKKIHDLKLFRAQSPFYDFIMPAHDNILGLEGVTSGSSVSDGYWVMLKPLSRGFHVIIGEAQFVSGPGAGPPFSVTYNLTIQ